MQTDTEFNNQISGSVLTVSRNVIFAGMNGSGVYFSSNNGKSWNQADSGLLDWGVLALTVRGTTLYAGTSIGGVWRADISAFTSVPEPPPVSSAMTLTALPNPARDEMLVRYNNAGDNAMIDLYNMLGERVMSAPASAAGETNLNVALLPSGMYMLELRSGMERKTQTVAIER